MPRAATRCRIVLLAALAVGVAACAKPPVEEIASAEAALEGARQADAPRLAPVPYRAAETMMTETYRLNDAKEYPQARTRAIETRDKANEARDAALKAKQGAGDGSDGDAARIEGTRTAAETRAEIAAETIGTGAMEEGDILKSLKAVYFDFDAATIRDGEREKLERAADWLRANPSAHMRLEGHTDERGSSDYNLTLGSRRADSVRQVLTSLGVEPERLTVRSYGEETPAEIGHDDTAWALNRRAEFVVVQQ